MVLAIVLVLLVVASVLFHLWSPWQATPIASNWGTIDDTLLITIIITGIFFVAIGLFMAIAIWRYRHKAGQRADYEPENKKLEWILIIVTTIGICGLLAPGLFVYGNFVKVPEQAVEVEAVAQQWRWSFRLPGDDGVLGKTAIHHVNADNPFGVDPNDPNGQDDRLINTNTLHLPIDQPVKLLLRSLDVLHNFYVPQFRVKMDSVPGLVSYMWFTPTRTGEFEILCSEYCGVGHYNMRGKVMVAEAGDYQRWLAEQPTFSESLTAAGSIGLVEQGRRLSQSQGCLACHSVDGSPSVGPGWQGLYGGQEALADGTSITVDDDYLKESITDPNAKLVQGYPPVMVAYPLSDEQLDAIVAYIKSLADNEAAVEMVEAQPLAATEALEETLEATLELAASAEGSIADPVAMGETIANRNGCFACHSVDGSKSIGPSWQGLWGKTETLVDGSRVVVDEDYFIESILQPNAKIVQGYPPVMVPYQLSDAELQALIAFAKSKQNGTGGE